MSYPIACKVEISQVAFEAEEGVLSEAGESVRGQGEPSDAGSVERVGIQLGDVVPLQVEGTQGRDLVDASRNVREPAVLDAEAGQGLLQVAEGGLVDVLEPGADDPQVGDGDVGKEPAWQVGKTGRQGGEGEAVQVVLDATKQAGDLFK